MFAIVLTFCVQGVLGKILYTKLPLDKQPQFEIMYRGKIVQQEWPAGYSVCSTGPGYMMLSKTLDCPPYYSFAIDRSQVNLWGVAYRHYVGSSLTIIDYENLKVQFGTTTETAFLPYKTLLEYGDLADVEPTADGTSTKSTLPTGHTCYQVGPRTTIQIGGTSVLCDMALAKCDKTHNSGPISNTYCTASGNGINSVLLSKAKLLQSRAIVCAYQNYSTCVQQYVPQQDIVFGDIPLAVTYKSALEGNVNLTTIDKLMGKISTTKRKKRSMAPKKTKRSAVVFAGVVYGYTKAVASAFRESMSAISTNFKQVQATQEDQYRQIGQSVKENSENRQQQLILNKESFQYRAQSGYIETMITLLLESTDFLQTLLFSVIEWLRSDNLKQSEDYLQNAFKSEFPNHTIISYSLDEKYFHVWYRTATLVETNCKYCLVEKGNVALSSKTWMLYKSPSILEIVEAPVFSQYTCGLYYRLKDSTIPFRDDRSLEFSITLKTKNFQDALLYLASSQIYAYAYVTESFCPNEWVVPVAKYMADLENRLGTNPMLAIRMETETTWSIDCSKLPNKTLSYLEEYTCNTQRNINEMKALAIQLDNKTISYKDVLAEYDKNKPNTEKIFKELSVAAKDTISDTIADVLGIPAATMSKLKDIDPTKIETQVIISIVLAVLASTMAVVATVVAVVMAKKAEGYRKELETFKLGQKAPSNQGGEPVATDQSLKTTETELEKYKKHGPGKEAYLEQIKLEDTTKRNNEGDNTT